MFHLNICHQNIFYVLSEYWPSEYSLKEDIFMFQLNGRAFVTVTEKGSTLLIGAAKTEDAGQYKCEVTVEQSPPELKHTVSHHHHQQ